LSCHCKWRGENAVTTSQTRRLKSFIAHAQYENQDHTKELADAL
jgi:hypothetical protein